MDGVSCQPLLGPVGQGPEFRILVHKHRPLLLGGGRDPGVGGYRQKGVEGPRGRRPLQQRVAGGNPFNRERLEAGIGEVGVAFIHILRTR